MMKLIRLLLPSDMELVPKKTISDYVAKINALEDENKTRHDALLHSCRVHQDETDELRYKAAEVQSRFDDLLQTARTCIAKGKFKDIRDYVDAYDKGKIIFIGEEFDIQEIEEIKDGELEELLDGIDECLESEDNVDGTD